MLQLSYGDKLFIRKFFVTSFQFITTSVLWYTLYSFKLNDKYDTILYNLYYTFLTLFTLLTILNIYLSVLYFINKNIYVDIVSYREWYNNQSVLRYEFKLFINMFLYLFGMVISIYGYATRIFFTLPIYYTIQLIIISVVVYIIVIIFLGMIILVYCFDCGHILSYRATNRINTNQPIVNNYVNVNINLSSPSVPLPSVPLPIQNLSLEIINLSTDTLCSICLDEDNTHQTWVKLPCQHKYHKLCIEKWLRVNLSCPMCRQEVINLI